MRVSLADLNSMAKSGQIGAKEAFSAAVRVFHRSSLIHDASGERVAPLGRVKPALESKPIPVPFCSVQTQSCAAILNDDFSLGSALDS
jgi:hypothetical protein